jgi:hypothetical protein
MKHDYVDTEFGTVVPVRCRSHSAHHLDARVLSFSQGCVGTVHRPGDDPRKECEECGNARGSNVRYYPT